MENGLDCCHYLFKGFTFNEISQSSPPHEKGVYCIRIKKRGLPTDEIEKYLLNHISLLQWDMVKKYLSNRIHRIQNISDCPIIYIGSAGTNLKSKHTLAGRYHDFARRHTAQYPIWALLYFGWELEYGWRVSENPAETELQLKIEYKKKHSGKLPALVIR